MDSTRRGKVDMRHGMAAVKAEVGTMGQGDGLGVLAWGTGFLRWIRGAGLGNYRQHARLPGSRGCLWGRVGRPVGTPGYAYRAFARDVFLAAPRAASLGAVAVAAWICSIHISASVYDRNCCR
ncbi:hypothetical protein D3C73_1002090 [compost metagenome]